MDDLSTYLFLELNDMVDQNKRLKQLGTLIGKTKHVAGHFMSVYCCWKIFFAVINLAFDRKAKTDPGARCQSARRYGNHIFTPLL